MQHMIKLTSKIWLALSSEQGLLKLKNNLPPEYQIVPFNVIGALVQRVAGCRRLPFSLSDIYSFSDMMQNLSKVGSSVKIVCAGVNPKEQIAIAFLLGCHLIMWNGLGFEEAYLAFTPLYETVDRNFGNIEFKCLLRALCCAKCLSWIDFRSDSDGKAMLNGRIEMDEFMHYSRHTRLTAVSNVFPFEIRFIIASAGACTTRFNMICSVCSPLNGSVHTIVPGELLLCDSFDSTLPATPGRQWRDHDGRRSFSADFYADLLRDLGVRLVVILPSAPGLARGITDALDDSNHLSSTEAHLRIPNVGAFARRGIRVLYAKTPGPGDGPARAAEWAAGAEDLAADAATAAAAAGGATALLCAPPALGHAATVAAAWVAARHRLFPSLDTAAAWVGLAAGPAAAAAMDMAGLRAEWARRRTLMFPAPPTAAAARLLHATDLVLHGKRRSRRGGSRSPVVRWIDAAAAPGSEIGYGGGEGGRRATWRVGGGAFSRSWPLLPSQRQRAGAPTAALAPSAAARTEVAGGAVLTVATAGSAAGKAPRALASAHALARHRLPMVLPLVLVLLPLLLNALTQLFAGLLE
jgi:hypothetical protein